MNLNCTSRKEFVKSFPPEFVIGAEIGVSHGDFSKNILEVRKNIKLYCIDTWETNYQLITPSTAWDTTVVQLSKYKSSNYELVKGKSPEISNQYADNYFDFVYIDADHLYEPVLADVEAWYPKVKSGGILFGHDYSLPWDGVIKAVDYFCKKNNYQVGLIHSKGYVDGDQDGNSNSWYIIKR
jgi:predicted O-methyltransferase YrrM